MNVLVKLDCNHTILLRDHPWEIDLLYFCPQCGGMKVVVDEISDREERGPDGRI